MTSMATPRQRERVVSLVPAPIDYALAAGAVVILASIVAAVTRGRSEWTTIPWPIWVHLATISGALVLTPIMLLRRRGDRLHRILGRLWIVLMLSTALISFGIRGLDNGGLSPIHLLSAFVIIQAPLAGWYAHKHDIRSHRRAVRGIVGGALLIAGAFTFPFGRLLGHWLFG
jgi:uncharacterized membrane protein